MCVGGRVTAAWAQEPWPVHRLCAQLQCSERHAWRVETLGDMLVSLTRAPGATPGLGGALLFAKRVSVLR